MWNRRGQSTAEYAVLVGVVIAAIVGMQIYVKRSIQGKVKGVADSFAQDASGVVSPLQYEPYYTAAGTLTTATTNLPFTETMSTGGTITRTGISDTSGRTGETVQGVDLTADDSWTP